MNTIFSLSAQFMNLSLNDHHKIFVKIQRKPYEIQYTVKEGLKDESLPLFFCSSYKKHTRIKNIHVYKTIPVTNYNREPQQKLNQPFTAQQSRRYDDEV